jgi:hypothetical protein
MSGKLAARGTRGTFVVVKHANQKRTDLSKHTKRTLGSGNLKEAVRLPKGEDLNEYVGAAVGWALSLCGGSRCLVGFD